MPASLSLKRDEKSHPKSSVSVASSSCDLYDPLAWEWRGHYGRRWGALAVWLGVWKQMDWSGVPSNPEEWWPEMVALSERLNQLHIDQVENWRQDPQAMQMMSALEGLLVHKPLVESDAADAKAHICITSDALEQAQKNPGVITTTHSSATDAHIEKEVESEDVTENSQGSKFGPSLIMAELIDYLKKEVRERQWRFVLSDESGGVRPVPSEDILAPAGYLPLLLWAAHNEALRRQRPLLGDGYLHLFSVKGPLDRIWGKEALMGCLPAWTLPVNDFATLPQKDQAVLSRRQARRWGNRVLSWIKGGMGQDHPTCSIFSLDTALGSWDARLDQNSGCLSYQWEWAEKNEMWLGYSLGAMHEKVVPTAIIFTQSPPEEENEHQSPLARLQNRRLRLVGWPHDEAWSALRAEFPWALETIDHLMKRARFGKRVGQSHFRLPPLLLVGQAGCGKTRLAQRLGEVCGIPNQTVSASGVTGSGLLLGTERHWSNASPSPILRFINQCQVANPLIVVDEMDKAADGGHGSLQNAILPLLEYESARRYLDPCLEVSCDLSTVNWILTANDLSLITTPLQSRLEVIEMGKPKIEHLEAIVTGVRRDLAREWHVPEARVPVWHESDTQWVRKQIGMGSFFTARTARKWIEQRLMDDEIRSDLHVVKSQ